MRIFHIDADRFTELPALPDAAPASGYLWVGIGRTAFEQTLPMVQAALEHWTGGQLLDLHVSDLLNTQLPSHFDYTSWYDMLVFRRLAAGQTAPSHGALGHGESASRGIDTSPVGFVVFDQVLLTVHPTDCQVRDFFANRLEQQTTTGEPRAATRMPTSPADLMLRMVNHIVDSYLDLRKLLTRQLDEWQQELFSPSGRFDGWRTMLSSRNQLHVVEDTCEDQIGRAHV